jgi:hypothetical protein
MTIQIVKAKRNSIKLLSQVQTLAGNLACKSRLAHEAVVTDIVKGLSPDTVKADIIKAVNSSVQYAIREAAMADKNPKIAGFNMYTGTSKTTGKVYYRNENPNYDYYISKDAGKTVVEKDIVTRGTCYKVGTFVARRLKSMVTKETSFAEAQKAWLKEPDFSQPKRSADRDNDRELETIPATMAKGDMAKGMAIKLDVVHEMIDRLMSTKKNGKFYTISEMETLISILFSPEAIDKALRAVNS